MGSSNLYLHEELLIFIDTFNANKRWVQCAYPDCPNYIEADATEPANYLRMISPQVPIEGRKEWYACEQHINQVKTDIQYIVELKFDNAPQTGIDNQLQQLLSLKGGLPLVTCLAL